MQAAWPFIYSQIMRSLCWWLEAVIDCCVKSYASPWNSSERVLEHSSMHAFILSSTTGIDMIVAQRLLAGHLSNLMLAGQHIWRGRGITAGVQHILHNSLAEGGNVAGHVLQVWHSPFPALDVLCSALPSGNQPAVEPQEPPVEDQRQKQGHCGYQQPAIHLQAAVRAGVDAESCGGICKGPGNQQPLE